MKTKRNWFFFGLKILPLIVIFACSWSTGFDNVITNINQVFSTFNVAEITTLMTGIFEAIGWSAPVQALQYTSYLIVVSFIQICYDFLMFLPNFARGFIEKWEQ